ncbi:hypothetical protein EOA24_25775 [Mesorhizobium sp. M2A.F.Ca.ET.039.01.1.1]|nr:hypothetical protein EOA24_25775 [Mesorhizobium sp. M2A.F.Ca.ET.039.01.1.1]
MGFVDHIVGQVAKKIGASSATFDIQDLGPYFARSKRLGDLDLSARNIVEQLSSAAVLVVGSPTFKGSYTGLFKHFFDLLEPSSLKGKPIILAATRHRAAEKDGAGNLLATPPKSTPIVRSGKAP